MVLIDIDKLKKRIATKKTSPIKVKEYVVIDYPQNGDKILPQEYTMRIGASNGSPVEVSIDNQPWVECRGDQGYYWYDWKDIPLGTHTCVARKKLVSGKYKKSKEVRCMATENLKN